MIGWTDDAALELVNRVAGRNKGGERPIGLRWLADLTPNLGRPWLISGLLPRSGLVVVYGESGSGKTYLVLDLALHVAIPRDWCGRRVYGGVVIYIAAENPASVENRAALWRRERLKGADASFAVVPHAVNLRDPDADLPLVLERLAEVEREHGPIAMVVVDTLARVMAGGNENSPEDMGAIIQSADRIRETLNTLVVLVHHAGKDLTKGARGHSSLRAAVDTEIEVKSGPVGHVAAVRKQRDGESGTTFAFRLRPVVLGFTPDGEGVSACLVDGLTEREGRAPGRSSSLTDREALALEALVATLKASRQPAPAEVLTANAGRVRAGQYVSQQSDWRSRTYASVLVGLDEDTRVRAFARIRDGLARKQRIRVWEGYVWEATE